MTLKLCSRCGELKTPCAFGKNAKRPNGLQDHCKACRAAYYAANAERIKTTSASHYAANAGTIAQRRTQFREVNKDRISAANRKAYAGFKATFVGPLRPRGLRAGARHSKAPEPTKTVPAPPATACAPVTIEQLAAARMLLAKITAEQALVYRADPRPPIDDALAARRKAALEAAEASISAMAPSKPLGRTTYVPGDS